jgi:hypothetical protein
VPEGSEEPEEYKYWPLCYLFADTQVYKREGGQEPAKPEIKKQTVKVEGLEEALA